MAGGRRESERNTIDCPGREVVGGGGRFEVPDCGKVVGLFDLGGEVLEVAGGSGVVEVLQEDASLAADLGRDQVAGDDDAGEVVGACGL